MATTLTFNSLKEDLIAYLDRGQNLTDDPTVFNQLPRIINNAERRVARDLKVQGFIEVVTTNMTAGVYTYKKPDRWRRTVSIHFGRDKTTPAMAGNRRTPVYARSYEYCRNYWPDDTLRGTPEFYADYNYDHWLIAPTPDADYPMEITYYEMPRLLDETFQSNWLTERAPNLLLYAALLEMAPFLRNDERIPVWQQMYSQALAALSDEDVKKIVDRATTRQEA